MRVRERLHALIAGLVVTLTLAAPSAAMMTRGHLPLATVAHDAGRIVHATVRDARSGTDDAGTPVTWVTFDVTRTLKGKHEARMTIKQFGRSDTALGRIPGLPAYVPGEEVVVFLRPESRRGFTSPVGLGQGLFRAENGPKGRAVRAALATGPAEDMPDFLARVRRRAGH